MTVPRGRAQWQLSAAPKLKRPANLEDVAFWPVRHLAELIRTRQVTSLELTADQRDGMMAGGSDPRRPTAVIGW